VTAAAPVSDALRVRRLGEALDALADGVRRRLTRDRRWATTREISELADKARDLGASDEQIRDAGFRGKAAAQRGRR
jgi:hypothetical protein